MMVSSLFILLIGTSLLIGRINGKRISLIPLTIAQRSTAQVLSSAFIASSTIAAAAATTTASTPTPSLAKQLNDQIYTKSQFNLPPSLTTYPSNFAGIWTANYKYVDASFTTDIPLKELSSDVNVAGFRKYSVAFVPDIGADFITNVQFKRGPGDSSNSVVEDRQFNLINTLQSVNKATVDGMVYEPDKNANRLSLKYTDPRGTGKIELFSNYRSQGMINKATYPESLFATYGSRSGLTTSSNAQSGTSTSTSTSTNIGTGTNTGCGCGAGSGCTCGSITMADLAGGGYRTFESMRQVSVRTINGQQASEIYCDYGLECAYYPLMSRVGAGGGTGSGTESGTESGGSGGDSAGAGAVDTMLATVKIFSYLIPQDGLYFSRPEKPVGVFLYAVVMRRV